MGLDLFPQKLDPLCDHLTMHQPLRLAGPCLLCVLLHRILLF